MPTEKKNLPEIKLLNSIIEDELKKEDDSELKEMVKRKANNLYPLLSLAKGHHLDNEEIKKKIKLLIEGRE